MGWRLPPLAAVLFLQTQRTGFCCPALLPHLVFPTSAPLSGCRAGAGSKRLAQGQACWRAQLLSVMDPGLCFTVRPAGSSASPAPRSCTSLELKGQMARVTVSNHKHRSEGEGLTLVEEHGYFGTRISSQLLFYSEHQLTPYTTHPHRA